MGIRIFEFFRTQSGRPTCGGYEFSDVLIVAETPKEAEEMARKEYPNDVFEFTKEIEFKMGLIYETIPDDR